MKSTIYILAIALAAFAISTSAAETNVVSADAEAKYTAAIAKRTDDILKALALTDEAKSAKVHDAIIAQYRALNAWHNENDAKLKAVKADTNATAQIRASLKGQHEKFLAALAENLTPEQVETVKDKMTYGKVQFTFKGYLNEYPDLTEPQRAEVLRLLKAAREEAMDGGSSDEKSAIFNRYKGKINNYLSKQGVQSARAKSKSAAPASTNSAPR